jgi:hypothetical protein
MADFYKRVPKEIGANIQYRLNLRRRAESDVGFQQAMLTACKHDVLFFFSAFCWLYEPRPRFGRDGRLLPKQIPFIPWDHQEPVILQIRQNLGIKDIGIEKSRGEGMSWIGVLMALHDWLFDDMAKVGLVSNTEKKSDDPGNMDSLMAKIDWELTKLPRWMAGVKDYDYTRNLSDHSLVNHRNLSQINAFAATDDAGRAGRYKWFMPDELAFWDRGKDAEFMRGIRDSTDSRLVISTPNGNDGVYYQFMHTPSNALRLRLHWSMNNYKAKGLYRFQNGVPVSVDPVNNPLPPEYSPPSQKTLDMFSRLRLKGFKLEGKDRSPWYDTQCDRADATPFSIAQELDLDYGGAMYRIFQAETMEKARKEVKEPLIRGVLTHHPETLEPDFARGDDGPLLLWTSLDSRNRPAQLPYVVSADISSGLGGSYTSNSVAQVISLITMEQVAEFSSNTIEPADFADFCMALGYLFHDAYLAWEANGPGKAFTKRVLAKKYPHCYERTQLWKRSKKKTKEVGWWTDEKSKEAMFGELVRSVKNSELVVHSKKLVDEFGQYVRKNGKIDHVLTSSDDDDSSTGQAHGDRVIAIGVGLMAARDRPAQDRSIEDYLTRNPPRGTIAERLKEYEDSLKNEGDGWDDRDNAEMARSTFKPRLGRSLADTW